MATVRSPQKKNPKEMPQAGVPTRSESSDIIRHDPLEESQDDVQLMGVLNQTINIGRGRGVPVEANENPYGEGTSSGGRAQSRVGRGEQSQTEAPNAIISARLDQFEKSLYNLSNAIREIKLHIDSAGSRQTHPNPNEVRDGGNCNEQRPLRSIQDIPEQFQPGIEHGSGGVNEGFRDHANARQVNYPRGDYKPIPVKEWGIKFSGDGKGMRVQAFIREMERMASLQGVRVESVLSSLHLCLTGDALEWYRSSEIFLTWREFSYALKFTFGRTDCDLTIRRKIEERKQKEGERVGVYLSAMRALFKELELALDEATQIQLVRRNLIPQYRDPLLYRDFFTLEDLEYALHRIEQNLLLSLSDRPKTQKVNAVQTSSNAQGGNPSRSAQQSRPQNNSRNSSRSQNLRPRENNRQGSGRSSLCVNCYLGNHAVENCSQPRRAQILCYGCGAENVTKRDCPNCCRSGEGQEEN